MEQKSYDDRIYYDDYNLSIKEKVQYSCIGFMGVFLLTTMFYNNYIISGILSLTGLYYPYYKRKELIKKRKKELKNEFKEGIFALATSLEAGKSIEMAFRDGINDLKLIYPDENTYIIQEFMLITRKLGVNETIEEALMDFAYRANIEDINNFVDVFITTKRTGGDIVKIIKYTSTIINEKLDIENEIQLVIAQKKFEQLILSLFIPLIILYLQFVSPEYLNMLYHTGFGRIIMTVSLVLYIISIKLGNKIMDIEV